MTSWIQDVRIAWRQSQRSPGATLLLVAILALGTGSAIAMFSVLRPVLLQSVPYPEPDRLVFVWQTDLANGERFGGASFPDLADWRAQSKLLSAFGAYARDNATVRLPGGSPQRTTAINVTHDLPATLGIRPLHGRAFARDDDRVGAAPVVMLSHEFWRASLGGDLAVIGRTLEVDGHAAEVIGVMPAGGPWALGGDVWRPIEPEQANFVEERGVHSLRVLARLQPHATLEQADAEMKAIMAALEQAHPEENKGRSSQIVPMHAHLVRDLERPLWLLGATIAVLLLLTCSNAAALLLARTSARETEIAVRGSLGASRGRLLAQVAIECLAIAAMGAAAGLLLAHGMLRVAAALNPVPTLDPAVWRMDGAVLGFALATCVVSAVLAGTMPAWLCSRVAPARALGATRGAIGAGGATLRRILVSAQVAIALLLLMGVGVLLRSYAQMSKIDLGVRAEGVVSVTLALPSGEYPMPPLGQYPEWPEVTGFMDALSERVGAIPGVESFGMMVHAPLASAWTTSAEVEGRDVPADAHEEWEMQAYAPGVLRTLGIPLLAGRDLDARDVLGAPMVLMINEAAARRYFPGVDPIGKRIRFWDTWREVVGVVGDVRTNGATEPAGPALHPPLAQTPFSTFSVVVRTTGDPAMLVPSLRDAVWAVDADVVPYGEATVAARAAELTAPQRFMLSVSGLLAALGAVLAVSGIVGMIAVDVQRRRGEIGVRVALGARAREVLATIMTRSFRLVGIGMAAGLAAFLLAAPALDRFAFGVTSRDPVVVLGVLLLFAVSAGLASLVPARRALAIEPMQVLRSD